jgi:hypothetical protein
VPRRFLTALFLFAGLFASATGQARNSDSAVIRTMTGVRYLVPAGWTWTEFNGYGPVFQHVATKAGDKGGPNDFKLGARTVPDDALDKGWARLDRSERRTFAGGATATWRAGTRWGGIHYVFDGEITLGSRVLHTSILDTPTPKFDPAIVEAAFLAIAESARQVPETRTFYHPTLAMAADDCDDKAWYKSAEPGGLYYGCFESTCGKGSNAWIALYPAQFPDMTSALSDITGYFEKNMSLKIGATQRQEIADGEIVWTEQPGSSRPLLGVVRRAGHQYFVRLDAGGTVTRSLDLLRADFLGVAKTIRAWDGQ